MIYLDEQAEISEAWFKVWSEEYEHGKRKSYSGERVRFTMNYSNNVNNDTYNTFSWFEPDPEYAKPALQVT